MNHFQKYLAEEFAEDYQEGLISRREALRLIGSVTGSLVTAGTILAACVPAPATDTGQDASVPPAMTAGPTLTSQQPATGGSRPTQPAVNVSENDPDVRAGEVTFTGADGQDLLGYLARPQGEGPFAVVLVCHENRGLTEHIRDVTRRLAKAGYAALAVDLLSRLGGSAAHDAGDVPGLLGNIDPEQFVRDFLSGWNYLKAQDFAQAERVGMVGFCFGGGVTWLVATRMPELRAAVPFYGPHPPLDDVANIQAAVLAVYGGLDARITGGAAEIEAAMQSHHKIFEKIIYPDADHAFHNDTGPRYNPQAAQDAWRRTLEWFDLYLA
ncbi:MAG: dienelactone hydrolase family protein [Anaerolineaceae bacterium]|nr:dienelactone hydrolase family protein [Anaerolineaceae bacterium]